MEQVGLTLGLDDTYETIKNMNHDAKPVAEISRQGGDPFLPSLTNSGKVNFVKPAGATNIPPRESQHETCLFPPHEIDIIRSDFDVSRPLFDLLGEFAISPLLSASPLSNVSLSILARSNPSCNLSHHGICCSFFS